MGEIPIGFIIKKLREDTGISQRKLGKLSGIDRGYISLLESGKNCSITINTAEKLAKGLGVSPSQFIDMVTIEDSDIKGFLVNEFSELDNEEKDWLRRTINMVRERKNERQKYDSGEKE